MPFVARRRNVATARARDDAMSFRDRYHSSGPISGARLDAPLRELMRPGVIALADDASLHQAERAMVSHGVHAVLILGSRSGQPLGWVTARRLLGLVDRDPVLTSVRNAITQDVVSLRPGATAREAIAALAGSDASYVLVSKREGCVPEGVVSELDLLALVWR
jgi:CBS domain-containing protein